MPPGRHTSAWVRQSPVKRDVLRHMAADDPASPTRGRPPRNRRGAHELADCLWSIFTLADCDAVDLESAFAITMKQLSAHLDSLEARS